MKVYITILFVISAVFTISAGDEEISDETCPKVQVVEKFNETRFAGQWYDIQQFKNTLITSDCGSPNYTVTTEGYDVNFPVKNLTDGISLNIKFRLKRTALANPGIYDVQYNLFNPN